MKHGRSLPGPGLLGVLLLLAAPGPAPAQDDPGLKPEEQIDITDRAISKVPILVERFATGIGAAGDDTRAIYDVAFQDLEFSGVFQLLPIPRLEEGDVLPAGRAVALVRGTVEITQGELVLRGVLESIPGRSVILSRNYRGAPETYRELAHRFADDIVLFLTGTQGIARTRIAFVSDRTGNKEVYLVDYDGYGLRQVTHNGSINLSPAWSREGDRMAYVSFLEGGADIHLLDLGTGESRLLMGGAGVQSAPAFSPDGTQIAYSNTSGTESEIYVAGVDGSGKRRVTRTAGINTSPGWSPDGRNLVFTSDRSGNPQIYVVDAEGGAPRRLTFNGKWNDLPSWSPVEDRIAYAFRVGSVFRIALVEAAGLGDERQLTRGPGTDENPSWAPDGRHLVYSSGRGGKKSLYILNTDTGVVRPLLVGEASHEFPAWSPVPPR